MTYTGIAEQLVTRGYAKVTLTGPDRAALAVLAATAADFFGWPEPMKRRHGDGGNLYGYRPYKMQDSGDPGRPDLCESFAYGANEPGLIPEHGDIRRLCSAAAGYWTTAARITAMTLAELAGHYGDQGRLLQFGPTSYIEVNWYARPERRDMLQTRHEDGHLISLVVPDRPGLEIERDGRMRPADTAAGEMLIMPGSVLTAMTAGEIPPLYHQVRNHNYPHRTTVLFFANTPMRPGSVRPYVQAEGYADPAALCLANATNFGRPAPAAASG